MNETHPVAVAATANVSGSLSNNLATTTGETENLEVEEREPSATETIPKGQRKRSVRKRKGETAAASVNANPHQLKRKDSNGDETKSVRISRRGRRKASSLATDNMTKLNGIEVTGVMAEEIKKANPNLMFLAKAMAQTFQERSKLIREGEMHVRAIVGKYPALMNYNIVKEEYNCVLGKHDKMESLERALADLLKGALKIKPVFQNALTMEAIEIHSQTSNRDLKLEQVLGMLLLSSYFAKENVELALCRFLKEEETLEQPTLNELITPTLVLKRSDVFSTENDNCWIYVESEKYLQVPNYYEGMLCIYAIHYIFNLHYDPRLTSLFEFFDMINGNPQCTFTKTKSLWEEMLVRRTD